MFIVKIGVLSLVAVCLSYCSGRTNAAGEKLSCRSMQVEGGSFYWGERMNWYILVLIIDVPAVHLSIFYLGSDIQGWKMNTEGVAQMRRI